MRRVIAFDCPKKLISTDAYDAFNAERLASQGSWPILAGWLEQTQCCLDAVDCVRAEREKAKERANSGR